MCNVVKKMAGIKARMRKLIRQVYFQHHSLNQIYRSAKEKLPNHWSVSLPNEPRLFALLVF